MLTGGLASVKHTEAGVNSYSIEDLKPFTLYKIFMSVQTRVGEGEISAALINRTGAGSKFFFPFHLFFFFSFLLLPPPSSSFLFSSSFSLSYSSSPNISLFSFFFFIFLGNGTVCYASFSDLIQAISFYILIG